MSISTRRLQRAISGATPPPAGRPTVGVIGDSLTVDMAWYSYLQDGMAGLGWQAGEYDIDAQSGRGIAMPNGGSSDTATPYTSEVITAWRGIGFDPRVWMIALGTNNSTDTDAYWTWAIQSVIDQIMAGPRGDYRIYWLGTGYAGVGEFNTDAFQTKLDAFTNANSFFTACDYNAYLAPKRSDPLWDSWWYGIHNTQVGYRDLRTPFYLSILQPISMGIF